MVKLVGEVSSRLIDCANYDMQMRVYVNEGRVVGGTGRLSAGVWKVLLQLSPTERRPRERPASDLDPSPSYQLQRRSKIQACRRSRRWMINKNLFLVLQNIFKKSLSSLDNELFILDFDRIFCR